MSSVLNPLRRGRAFLQWTPHQLVSYAQEGEDLLLSRIFGPQERGYYVDVGAHHPLRFSNTYLFYRRGWRGINIDATPGCMRPFRKIRPHDVNLEIPVMRDPARLTYYQFNEPALNSFSKDLSESRNGRDGYRILRTSEIQGRTLRDILQEHLPQATPIDFLTVDVEGWDVEVLESNDWTRFRPKVVLVEMLFSSLSNLHSNAVYQLLENHRYQIFAKTLNTVFFLSEEYVQERLKHPE